MSNTEQTLIKWLLFLKNNGHSSSNKLRSLSYYRRKKENVVCYSLNMPNLVAITFILIGSSFFFPSCQKIEGNEFFIEMFFKLNIDSHDTGNKNFTLGLFEKKIILDVENNLKGERIFAIVESMSLGKLRNRKVLLITEQKGKYFMRFYMPDNAKVIKKVAKKGLGFYRQCNKNKIYYCSEKYKKNNYRLFFITPAENYYFEIIYDCSYAENQNTNKGCSEEMIYETLEKLNLFLR